MTRPTGKPRGRPKKITRPSVNNTATLAAVPPPPTAAPLPGSAEAIAEIQAEIRKSPVARLDLSKIMDYHTNQELRELRADLAAAEADVAAAHVLLDETLGHLKAEIALHKTTIDIGCELGEKLTQLSAEQAPLEAFRSAARSVEARVAGELAEAKAVEDRARERKAAKEQRDAAYLIELSRRRQAAWEKIGPLKTNLAQIERDLGEGGLGNTLTRQRRDDKALVQQQIDELQKIVAQPDTPAPDLAPTPAAPAPAPAARSAARSGPVGINPLAEIQERLLLEPTLEERSEAEKGLWVQKPETTSAEDWAANQERVRTAGNATGYALKMAGLEPFTHAGDIETARKKGFILKPRRRPGF
jgi:hypothetical protein